MHPGRPCDLFSQTLLGRLVEDANAVVDAEAGMLPGQEVPGKVLVEEFALYQEVDNPTPEYLDHGVQSRERYVEERTFIIEAALQNDSVEMRFAPQPITKRLMRHYHAGEELSSSGFMMELPKDLGD
jgi:hypothetical protein